MQPSRRISSERSPSVISNAERLWKSYFTDPSLWLDKRKSKLNLTSPDFKHVITKESLWIDGWNNPGWVKNVLERMECASTGMHKATESSAQDPSNSETPDMVEECGKARFRSGVPVNACKPKEPRGSSGWEMLSLEEALTSLEEMPQPPPVESFTCILNKCRKKKNLAYAQRLHAYMCRSGLESRGSLGNYLIPILVEVGRMRDAQQVFNRLADRNEYSWTSLITGYMECGELRHALNLYQKMQEDCVHPSEYTFVALLKVCARLKDVERGQEIHAEIVRNGLERDLFIGNSLLDMYAKCGLLSKAREVFANLPARDVVSWTALIAAYTEHGFGHEALNCFERMQLEGVSPNAVTFVCSLKASGSIGAIDKGKEIHAEIARNTLLENNTFVGNALVDMYAKCGLLSKAQEVFDKLRVRNEVSWNALITGYAKLGLGEEALDCFKQMQLEGISPNAVTFLCSLRACGSVGAIEKGIEISAEIARRGLERDLVIGNTLVDMYAKCGSLAKAQEVFNKLHVRDVVSWNALIAAYAKQELGDEALNCFQQMQLEGVSPNAVTLLCILKACGSTGAIGKGQEIHDEVARKGLESDIVVGSTLVDMYGKCGFLAKAREMFDKLPVRNEVSWNALITAYMRHGFGEETLNCFDQMQLEGIAPSVVTCICSLKACGNIRDIDKGQEIHAEIDIKGFESDAFVGSALVDMYAKCGLPAKAQEVFDKLPGQNEFSWNGLIAAYAEHGLGEKALNCFEQMQLEGISPDAVTFVWSLKACGSIGAIDKGVEIHAEIARIGLESDLIVGSALVDMYAKCGLPAKAQEMFDQLPVRDVILWNTLIAGYAHLGESESVFHMLERMTGEGIKPNGVTFLSVLTACCHTGLVCKGQYFFHAMSKDYGVTPTIEHHTCMVDLLGRAGRLDELVVMMKHMPCLPDPVVWHTVLGACRKWGDVDLGRHAFEHALQLDERDAAAYVFMSNIYAHAEG